MVLANRSFRLGNFDVETQNQPAHLVQVATTAGRRIDDAAIPRRRHCREIDSLRIGRLRCLGLRFEQDQGCAGIDLHIDGHQQFTHLAIAGGQHRHFGFHGLQ